MQVDHAGAIVHFPAAASGSLRAQAFTGVYGSTQRDATAKVNGADAQFETTNPLPMRGGMPVLRAVGAVRQRELATI